VKSNPFFSDLLKNKVTFYRKAVPPYGMLIHPGGAPSWVVRRWLALLAGDAQSGNEEAEKNDVAQLPLIRLIGKDFAKVKEPAQTPDDAAIELLEAAVETGDTEGEDFY
jgi:hypothetical protein